MKISRRGFLGAAAGAGVVMDPRAVVQAARQVVTLPQSSQPQARGQQAAPPKPNLEPWVGQPQPYPYVTSRSAVSLVKGESRRKNITDALVAIDDQIRPVLKTKKYVILKPNCVSQVPLGTTNAEALMGILDYLAPRYKGPIVICRVLGEHQGELRGARLPEDRRPAPQPERHARGPERRRPSTRSSRCSTTTRTSSRCAWRRGSSTRTPTSSAPRS